jgi:tetratricopeptide (TPR) repeat protein
MIVPGVQLDGEAARAAAEGQAALDAGDTQRARERFRDAGAAVEARVGQLVKQPAKQLARFAAAAQYHRGGHYRKALELAQRVEARFLGPQERQLYQRFFRDVKGRASPYYEASVRRHLSELWQQKDYPDILQGLQEHPYALPPASLAFLRGACRERLGDHGAAAGFYAAALKGIPDDPGVVLSSAGLPLALARAAGLAEAWKLAESQLKETPHPATSLAASLLRFHQAANAAAGEERGRLLDEQMRHWEEARRLCPQLPPRFQANSDFRDFMALGFEAAAFALSWAGQPEKAREVLNAAVALAPRAWGPRTARGLLSYPGPEAVEDFREATRLGEPSYHPYYFLAHASLVAGDLPAASRWCRQTLGHAPGRELESQLASWLAFAEAQAAAAPEQAAALVRESAYLGCDRVGTGPPWLDYLAARESQVLQRRARTNPVPPEPAQAGV